MHVGAGIVHGHSEVCAASGRANCRRFGSYHSLISDLIAGAILQTLSDAEMASPDTLNGSRHAASVQQGRCNSRLLVVDNQNATKRLCTDRSARWDLNSASHLGRSISSPPIRKYVNPAPSDWGIRYCSCFSIAPVTSLESGVTAGSNRCTTLPFRSTRNLVKFHLMSPLMPRRVCLVR